MTQFAQIQQARDQYKTDLMGKPNVVGVGVSYKAVAGQSTGELCRAVLVQKKLPKAGLTTAALVPPEIDGIRTDVIQVGELRPLQARTDRWRPARGGSSLGHYQITAGTFGTVVRDRSSGVPLGNSDLSREDLGGTGVVASTGGVIPAPPMPYLCRIEINSQNSATVLERSRLSVLYAY